MAEQQEFRINPTERDDNQSNQNPKYLPEDGETQQHPWQPPMPLSLSICICSQGTSLRRVMRRRGPS